MGSPALDPMRAIEMKSLVLCSWLVFAAAACSAPSSELFAPSDGPAVLQPSGGSGPGAAGSSTTAATGGMGAVGNAGGSQATAGSDALGGTGTAGNGSPQGEGGAAGAGDREGGAGGADEQPAVCGNGVLEAGEECDDGGNDGQDGCVECQVTCSHFGEGSVKSDDNHCYNGYDEANFEGARADCAARGGHLVTISSQAENDIVQGFVAFSKFIGAFEDVPLMSGAAAEYQWVTGEPFDFENWDGGQPDREDSRCGLFNVPRCYEHCAAMLGDGSWVDQRCDLADGYVCEWEPAGS